MYLSDFQKQIVRRIANEDIQTIQDFFITFELVIPYSSSGESDFFFDREHFKIVNREDTFNKLLDFKRVINLLTKAEQIFIENSSGQNFGYSASENCPMHIIALINSFRDIRIIPYNEIVDFAKDFRTPQERNQLWQRWIPIIIAIATVILSSILNYFIYTKEREVFIKNVNAFNDTLNVKILNDVDSSLIKKSSGLDSINAQKKIFPKREMEEE